MTISTERFFSRYAGSTSKPFVVEVTDEDGSLLDLTGDTATMTMRKAKGVGAVMVALPNSNLPGLAGVFSFQPTVAHVSSPGEYVVTVDMVLSGKPDVGRFVFTINPAT